jgi:hypothetical protein
MASDHNRYLREVNCSRLIGLEKICFNKANKAGRPTRQVGRQGRWARSIDVPTLTVIIFCGRQQQIYHSQQDRWYTPLISPFNKISMPVTLLLLHIPVNYFGSLKVMMLS